MSFDCIDFVRLKGQEVTSVMIMTNCVRIQLVKYPLHTDGEFTDSAIIDIANDFEVECGEGSVTTVKFAELRGFRRGAAAFIGLIEHSVKDARFDSNGNLFVEFDNYMNVTFLKSKDGLESFSVNYLGLLN